MKTYSIIIVAIAFFGYIFFLIKRRQKIQKFKNLFEEDEVGTSGELKNIVDSITKSKKLYKSLITKVHPDKFEHKFKLEANNLSARITAAKRNYNKLKKLELEVNDFLELKS